MTLRGFIVTLLELVLVVFAFGTEMREFLVVALCVGVLEVYSFVSIFLASLTLNVHSKIDKSAAVRLEGTNYTFLLRGIALLPVAGYLSVKNADYEPKHLKRKKHSFLMLPSFVIEHRFKFEIPCKHIGVWEVGIKKLRFEDLFGLFSVPLIRSRKSKFSVKLSVMPQLHKLENDDERVTMGDFGLSSSVDSEQGELLGDSRLYREGDTLKRINWKLSVRTKSLYSRQYEMPQKPKICIAVDTAVQSYATGDIIDISCEAAISLAKFFIEQEHAIDIVTIREKNGEKNTVYSLSTEEDILRMQYSFASVDFYNSPEELVLSSQIKAFAKNADKLFLVTSNPSAALLSDFAEMDKNNKMAVCIVPAPILEDAEEDTNYIYQEARVNVSSPDTIKERVGGIL